MPWQKMLFRSDPVWVHVGEDGRPVLDSEGRAEMKYRENDTKTYRPQTANLTPARGAGPPRDPPDAQNAVPKIAKTAATKTGSRNREHSASRTAPRPADDGAALEIWTDGACSGNPGPMGIGVVVIDGRERDEIGEYLGTGTNNIAELVAIERGLEVALGRLATTTRPVRVHSDSAYAIGLLDKGWKAKANQDLVARIRRQLAAFPARIDFVKVAGHAGIAENERCDELARLAVIRRG
jgi:ribonuclease HI